MTNDAIYTYQPERHGDLSAVFVKPHPDPATKRVMDYLIRLEGRLDTTTTLRFGEPGRFAIRLHKVTSNPYYFIVDMVIYDQWSAFKKARRYLAGRRPVSKSVVAELLTRMDREYFGYHKG